MEKKEVNRKLQELAEKDGDSGLFPGAVLSLIRSGEETKQKIGELEGTVTEKFDELKTEVEHLMTHCKEAETSLKKEIAKFQQDVEKKTNLLFSAVCLALVILATMGLYLIINT